MRGYLYLWASADLSLSSFLVPVDKLYNPLNGAVTGVVKQRTKPQPTPDEVGLQVWPYLSLRAIASVTGPVAPAKISLKNPVKHPATP